VVGGRPVRIARAHNRIMDRCRTRDDSLPHVHHTTTTTAAATETAGRVAVDDERSDGLTTAA